MKISARNCIEGKVVAIHDGPVSTEVTVETPAGERIVSSITTTSAKALGLKGAKAYAVIKASTLHHRPPVVPSHPDRRDEGGDPEFAASAAAGFLLPPNSG